MTSIFECYHFYLRFADTLQETLGFDWLLLFLHPHVHKTTVVRATRILVIILGSQATLERFKEGVTNGGWLAGTEMILNKNTYVVAGMIVIILIYLYIIHITVMMEWLAV
jgi:hypothetical protein